MRLVPLFSSALIALALGGCMQRQPAYYMVDPATGRMIPLARNTMQPAYSPTYQTYASASPQRVYSQPLPPTQPESRALFSSSPAAAQQSYAQAQPAYAPPAYGYPPAQRPADAEAQSEQRGLFTSLRRRAPQPVYAAAPRVGGPYAAAPANTYASVTPNPEPYTLDAGDKLRVVVFGQDGITNSYIVGADGQVNLPLIGNVPARGSTSSELAQRIAERLKQGYVREPHVSVEVEAYRPFFILGEVTTPGQYPYVANMTAETAVAIAGGFSPRADKRKVQLSRNVPGQQIRGDVPLSYPLRPGDTIMVKERWF
jgi:polysaccharide export outer membrane protein